MKKWEQNSIFDEKTSSESDAADPQPRHKSVSSQQRSFLISLICGRWQAIFCAVNSSARAAAAAAFFLSTNELLLIVHIYD
jgi:hypothetical protein